MEKINKIYLSVPYNINDMMNAAALKILQRMTQK